MESGDDFVVVDEETSPQRMELDRLSVLVDLFSKSLDALNQSNILLKDQLYSAMTVTLRNIEPDFSTPIDNLVKALESNVTSTEEVRANHTRQLCSRLVSVSEEKQAVLAELVSLKDSIAENDAESAKQLEAASSTTGKILAVLNQLEGSEPEHPEQLVKLETIADVNKALSDVHERLSKLQVEGLHRDVPVERIPVSVLGTQTSIHCTETSTQCDVQPETVETESAQEERTPEPPEPANTETQPSFSAQEEDPWCPCCCQRFGCRDDLEQHLQECLQ